MASYECAEAGATEGNKPRSLMVRAMRKPGDAGPARIVQHRSST